MLNLTEKLYIKCKKCGYVTLIEANSLEYDTSTYERAMGGETEYNFYGNICCKKCNRWIDFSIRGYEYPVGDLNFYDYDCNGGEFVKAPTLEIVYEFDESYSDYVYSEYIKVEDSIDYYKEQIKNMSSRDFEFFVGGILERLGFSVKITQATRDGGRDIIATKSDPIPYTLFVECKHKGENYKVDVSVVRSLYGVQTAMQANQSIVVTSSKFTRDARKFAEERKTLMALWDIDDLINLILNTSHMEKFNLGYQ